MVDKLTFSPNGAYMLILDGGVESIYHLSTPWDITTNSLITTLKGEAVDDVIRRLILKHS